MQEKNDLSRFEFCVVVHDQKKKSSSSLGKNALLMTEVRRQWLGADRKAEVTEITIHCKMCRRGFVIAQQTLK